MFSIFYQLLCLFLLYSFLGWGLEVAHCSIKTGAFVNRGFLNGPVCPIYGIGATLVVFCLQPLNDRLFLLFIASTILTSLLELLGGFVLDKLFHIKWWDYSDMPFHVGGYICLKFSLLWGVGCLFLVKFIHPPILAFVQWLPFGLAVVLLCIFYALFFCDLTVTVAAVLKMNRNLGEIAELVATLKSGSDKMAESLGNTALFVADKLDDLELEEKKEKLFSVIEAQREKQKEKWETLKEDFSRERLHTSYQLLIEKLFDNNPSIRKRLLRAFPNMKNKRNPDILKQLKAHYAKKNRKKETSKEAPAGEENTNSSVNDDSSK